MRKPCLLPWAEGKILHKDSSLLNLRFINWLTGTFITTVTTTNVKLHRFVNSIWPKRSSIDAFVAGLSALMTGAIGLFGFRQLNNIRGRRFGRVGRVLREFGDLFGKVMDSLFEFCNQGNKIWHEMVKIWHELALFLFGFRLQ